MGTVNMLGAVDKVSARMHAVAVTLHQNAFWEGWFQVEKCRRVPS